MRYHLVKAEADDHMPGRAASGLVPLRSWFSLDIAAQLDKGDAEEESEAEFLSTNQPRAMLPIRLPRLWSSHGSAALRSASTNSDSESQCESDTSPPETDARQLR